MSAADVASVLAGTADAVLRARCAGYTHVWTFIGPMPIDEWAARQRPGYVDTLELDDNGLVGPERPATVIEAMAYEHQTGTGAGLQLTARDRWRLFKPSYP